MKLFEPVKLGSLVIRNRIVAPALTPPGLAVALEGGYGQRTIDYLVERARSGAGLIITSSCKVENEIEKVPSPFMPIIWPGARPFLAELAGALHHYDTKLFVQLTAGLGHDLSFRWIDRGAIPVSASANPCFWRPSMTARAITTEEVEKLVKAFAEAAAIVAAAGCDGVELHGHGGYLLDEFTTTAWNRRNDRYGGDLEARLRFAGDIVRAIKEKAGKDFTVIYRYGLKHYLKGPRSGGLPGEKFRELGRDVDEGVEMARILERAGFDGLQVGAGCYEAVYWMLLPNYHKHGCMIEMAERVKKAVKIPVIAVGRLDDPDIAETALSEGKCDMVALGRALLADPLWPAKVRRQKISDIRPCIGCHDGCLSRHMEQALPVSCTVNPRVGRERLYDLSPVKDKRRVVVVGGGVAGMEAARVASLRGHHVTLYEKGDRLGGLLIAGSAPDFKEDTGALLEWYRRQLDGSKVAVRLGTEVTAGDLEKQRADLVVIATGSVPCSLDIKGPGGSATVTAPDLLLGRKKAGQRVVVAGGGLTGCETALWLARQGKKVSLVERLPEMALGVVYANRNMLLDLLAFHGVEMINSSTVLELKRGEAVIIDKGFAQRGIECDTLVVAVGMKADRRLYQAVASSPEVPEIYAIGDCKKPGKMLDAIWDGFHIGSSA